MKRRTLIQEDLTGSVIGAFYEVYNTLGFGFGEHIYSLALEREPKPRAPSRARSLMIVFYKGDEPGPLEPFPPTATPYPPNPLFPLNPVTLSR